MNLHIAPSMNQTEPPVNVAALDVLTSEQLGLFALLREDWQTHERDLCRQGLWALAVHRFGHWRYGVRLALIRIPLSFIYKVLKLVSQILTGIDLPCEVKVGRRLTIEHFGGIIISGDAVIGDDVVLRHGVTLGLKHTGLAGAPVIGNRVDIGAGAKILGPVHIGDGAVIGANAGVLKDVPPGALAVGVPARIKTQKAALVVEAEQLPPLDD